MLTFISILQRSCDFYNARYIITVIKLSKRLKPDKYQKLKEVRDAYANQTL